MPTLADAHALRWHAIKPASEIGDYHHHWAIPGFWRAHPEMGSPISPEIATDDGMVVQVFAGGVLEFDPSTGAVRKVEE